MDRLIPFSVTGPVTRRAYEDRFGLRLKYIFEGKDDENIVTKALVVSKYTGIATGFFTIIDVVGVNENKGVTHAIQRLLHHSRVLIGGGLSYIAAVNLAASLRHSNEATNHLWGGVGAGLVIGAHTKCIQTGFYSGAVIGITGLAYKEFVKGGDDLFPDYEKCHNHGLSLSHKMDFSLWPSKPGYWVRTQEEADEIVRTGSRKMF